MKKIWLELILVFLSIQGFGLSGDGSESAGFRGSLWNNTTFGPGVVFIAGNINTNGYTLNIAPGTILRISEGVQIEVNVGNIVALGTQANPIIFSARESSWGHINHYSLTGGTVFEFCTFQNGFSLTDYGWGGAIMIRNSAGVRIAQCTFDSNIAAINGGALYAENADGLTLIHNTFRNNTALEGGALFLSNSNAEITLCTFEGNSATKSDARGGAIFIRAPLGYEILIDRCSIHSNTSVNRTGGIHFDTGSGGTVQNSLIYANISSVGGGVNMGSAGEPTDGSVNIVNCLIAENTPCDVAFRTSNGYSVRNTIIWGSDNSVMYNVSGHTGQDPVATNLINSAVQGATDRNGIPIDIESTFTNSFKLHSSNSDPYGPNFTDPLAHDYRINFISPCRDKGTSNVIPTTPLIDYLENSRIGDPDIGAYEVQYSRWLGSEDNNWSLSSNWDKGVAPYAGTGDVVIPSGLANYPTGPVDQDFTVNAFRQMIIEPGAMVTLDDLTNNGSVLIKSSFSEGSGSLIVNGTSMGSGNVTFERSMPEDGSTPLWHYVSSPVSTPGLTASKGLYPWNEPVSDWGAMTTNIEAGIGYTIPGNDYISFSGSLNTSEVSVTATSPYSFPFGGSDYFSRPLETGRGYGGGGWNLLGNPYASALNVTEFIDANYNTDWQTSLFDPNYVALYLYNGNTYQYVTKDETGWGTSWPNGAYLDAKCIQAGQAFFVLAMNNGVRFNFLPSMQEHATGITLLKSAKAKDRWPGISLEAKNGSSESRTVIVFNSTMSVGLDPGYDIGYLSSASEVNIYAALVEDNGVNFAMQALPVDGAIENVIPIGIDFAKGGKVTFSAETEPLRNYKYWLEDRVTGIFTDLASNTYSVDLPARTFGTSRFFIHVTVGRNIRPQTNQNNLQNIRIWASQNREIKVQGTTSDKAICEVFDAMGHEVYESKMAEGDIHSFSVPAIKSGLYLVRVTDGVKTTITRVLFLK